MGLRIPEIGKDPVAHILCDKSAELADRPRRSSMIGADNRAAPIKPLSRPDRRTSPSAAGARHPTRLGRPQPWTRSSVGPQRGHRAEQLTAMPDEVYAEILQILCGQ